MNCGMGACPSALPPHKRELLFSIHSATAVCMSMQPHNGCMVHVAPDLGWGLVEGPQEWICTPFRLDACQYHVDMVTKG